MTLVQECLKLDYFQVPEWLRVNGIKLTPNEFQECLDYYYSEREWNSNCD